MPDITGYRAKFATIVPSTNTVVEHDFNQMRPHGITIHTGRMYIENPRMDSNTAFEELLGQIRSSIATAIRDVMTCQPDYLVMGMSAETFWDGVDGSAALQRRIEERAGVKVAMGSDACRAALAAYGGIRRIAVITPYMPVGDAQVVRFFSECGFEVAALKGLKCASPVQIAHVAEKTLRDAIIELNDPSIDAIVQVGTNLAMARLAAIAEFWLDKPVIAINTATYWWALRQNGITDRIEGFGSLLMQH
jgi:maleate isomerase